MLSHHDGLYAQTMYPKKPPLKLFVGYLITVLRKVTNAVAVAKKKPR